MISLRVKNLSKKYNQKQVLRDLSFDYEGGVLGISGSNGSGKSTLMKCIAYLLRPTKGEVIWQENERVLDQQEVKSMLGFAAPYVNLYSELTVAENLRFLVEAGGNRISDSKLDEIFQKVQIPHLENQSFGSLSTGQQQRVKLAGTLVRDSRILLLDEPGSNLDEKGQHLVKEIIEDAKSAGKKVIIASNNQNEIILCDQVVELRSSEQ